MYSYSIMCVILSSIFFLSILNIRSTSSWSIPDNDTFIIDKKTKLILQKIGNILPLTETTGIAVTIPIFHFGCFLLPPKLYSRLNICTENKNQSIKQNLLRTVEQQASKILTSATTNSSKKSFNQRFMQAWDDIDASNDRLVYLYNGFKTLQKVINTVVQQSIPILENELHYDKIHRSSDNLLKAQKNFDYLSRNELHQVIDRIFKQSEKILSLFDIPLMILINRLVALQSFHFAFNNDDNTNGNSHESQNEAIPAIYQLGNLIISNVVFIPRVRPSIPVYQVFNTPFFSSNASYQVYNLPRYIAIDYKNNQSLAWYSGDNNINTCHFGKITFCHVLPPVAYQRIEHGCLNKMFIENQSSLCS
ncbi:unnamed protein product, partial [Didymodactylos carnosus]